MGMETAAALTLALPYPPFSTTRRRRLERVCLTKGEAGSVAVEQPQPTKEKVALLKIGTRGRYLLTNSLFPLSASASGLSFDL